MPWTPPAPDEPAGARLYGRRKGKTLRAGRPALFETPAAPAAARPPAPAPPDLRTLFRRPRSDESGWRSASAAASICSPRPTANPEIGFIGGEPFVNGMAKALAGIDRARLDNVRLYDGDATALLDWLPDASVARRDRSALSRPLAEAAPLEAPLRVRRQSRPPRPGAEARRRIPLRHRHRDYVAWTLVHACRAAGFAWTAERADDWRRPWRGLARHPLRGEGAARGPDAGLSRLSARLGRQKFGWRIGGSRSDTTWPSPSISAGRPSRTRCSGKFPPGRNVGRCLPPESRDQLGNLALMPGNEGGLAASAPGEIAGKPVDVLVAEPAVDRQAR